MTDVFPSYHPASGLPVFHGHAHRGGVPVVSSGLGESGSGDSRAERIHRLLKKWKEDNLHSNPSK